MPPPPPPPPPPLQPPPPTLPPDGWAAAAPPRHTTRTAASLMPETCGSWRIGSRPGMNLVSVATCPSPSCHHPRNPLYVPILVGICSPSCRFAAMTVLEM